MQNSPESQNFVESPGRGSERPQARSRGDRWKGGAPGQRSRPTGNLKPDTALFTRRLVHAQAGEERELDESNPTRDDFLEWAYAGAGENPAAWQVSAKDLLDGAMAVKAKVQPFAFVNAMHPLARVEAMLLGMALECLLKGMYIKRHRVWEDTTKAHALVEDGAYVGPRGHNLPKLADAAGVTLSQSERSILTRLTDFIKYAGRYPISMRVEENETSQNARRAHGPTRLHLRRRTRDGRDLYQPPYARSWSLGALRTIRRGAVATARCAAAMAK